MTDNDELEGLTPEEKLQADSDLLKIKLEMEFGMQSMGSSPNLDDKMQNDFLNYIYNFEKEYAKNKRITVYEKIGKPDFKKAEDLSITDLNKEIHRLCELIEAHGMKVDTICEYTNDVIYKFITEELFDEEIDDMNVPGMVTHFTYEEYHPNHEHDIKEHSEDFLNSLINKKWKDIFETVLAESVEYNGIKYAKDLFVNIIETFQEAEGKMKIANFDPKKVSYDLKNEIGLLEGKIKYKVVATKKVYEGHMSFGLKLEYDYWRISKVILPGFSK
jgi:hypothetical protein